jgi:UDP-2-acetamido-2-deoxy-ribo-hexuluronate aminotransferase
MKKIQMVDVVSQYEKHSHEISQRIFNVLNSGSYIRGREVEHFEKKLSEYIGSKHTVTCANGTDAIQIALMSLNLSVGDEVIVPTFTFVSTVEAVCLLGLKPIFLDIHLDTFLLNETLVEESISKKTRAIIPVHLFGQCCNMKVIKSIADKYNLFIIEDAAQSIGSATYETSLLEKRFSGTIGDIGTTSFYPSKNLGCFGDGGAMFTNNDDLSEKIRLIANHGQREKYIHEIVGLNSRLDALQACVLSYKLSFLDECNKKRNMVAQYYNTELDAVSWLRKPVKNNHSDHIYHQYSILLDSTIIRDDFQKYLLENGIPSMIYYPIPLHKQKAYAQYSNKVFPVAEMVSNSIISLPIHPEMEMDQMEFICDKIQKYS